MKINLLLFTVLLMFMISQVAQSGELAKVGAYLEVKDPLTNFERRGDDSTYIAVRGTKFKIVYIDDNDTCYVEFEKIIKDTTITNPVTQDRRYKISRIEINESTCQFTRGLYAAALTVPFKYRFAEGDVPSALSTSFDISGAIGYSFGIFGMTLTPVGFVGLATISLGDANSSDVETRLGITFGLGIAFAFSETFQLGVIVGADHLTGSAEKEWPFQDKPWLSVGIGYKFLDF